MTQKKDRDRVMAEITLSHLLRLANEHGCPVSREQALAFLNQRGRAYEMWKHMMQAGEDFIVRSYGELMRYPRVILWRQLIHGRAQARLRFLL